MKRLLGVVVLAALVVLGVFAWMRVAPRKTPEGQAPLLTLAGSNLSALKDEFNAHRGEVRLVALLSPTHPSSLRAAAGLQDLLQRDPAQPVRLHVVWAPALPTDVAPPVTQVLGMVKDPRARQYWDPEQLLSKNLVRTFRKDLGALGLKDAQAGQVVSDHLLVFGKGARWTNDVPAPAFGGGSVVDSLESAAMQVEVEASR